MPKEQDINKLIEALRGIADMDCECATIADSALSVFQGDHVCAREYPTLQGLVLTEDSVGELLEALKLAYQAPEDEIRWMELEQAAGAVSAFDGCARPSACIDGLQKEVREALGQRKEAERILRDATQPDMIAPPPIEARSIKRGEASTPWAAK